MKVAQSCPALCDPMDLVHGILQARILEWVAFPFSGDFPNPGIEPRSPTLQADSLPAELWGKPWYPNHIPARVLFSAGKGVFWDVRRYDYLGGAVHSRTSLTAVCSLPGFARSAFSLSLFFCRLSLPGTSAGSERHPWFQRLEHSVPRRWGRRHPAVPLAAVKI